LQTQYQNYKNTLQQLAQKIGDIEQETEEHKLVIDTLEPLPKDRKCFRMINGVLVERTVKEVTPSLKTNADGLKRVLDELVTQYKAKQEEMDTWKVTLFGRFPDFCLPVLVLELGADVVVFLRCDLQKKNHVQVVQQ
ncbi:hypothetical protein AJ80_10034, partial [Polytolypa hystricis UAMH7299]